MKTPSLLSLSLVAVTFAFSPMANTDDASEAYKRNQLSNLKGLEDSAYYKSLKGDIEGTTPKDEKTMRAERKEAVKSAYADGSIDKLKALAEKGDTDAMTELGKYYATEQKDKAAAHAWYRKAAESGNEDANLLQKELEGTVGIITYCEIGGCKRVVVDREKSGYVVKNNMTPEEEEKAEGIYIDILKNEMVGDTTVNIKDVKQSDKIPVATQRSDYLIQQNEVKKVNIRDINAEKDKVESINEIDCNEVTRSCRLQTLNHGESGFTPNKE